MGFNVRVKRDGLVSPPVADADNVFTVVSVERAGHVDGLLDDPVRVVAHQVLQPRQPLERARANLKVRIRVRIRIRVRVRIRVSIQVGSKARARARVGFGFGLGLGIGLGLGLGLG